MTVTTEEQIAALRFAINVLKRTPGGLQKIAALRDVIVALEASRWRLRSDAPDTDDPIIGYSPTPGRAENDEQPGHYVVTTGRFLRSGGWEACAMCAPILPLPSPPAHGGEG